LGLAVLTAVLTTGQAQSLGDRSALIGASTPLPHLGGSPKAGIEGMFAVYQQTQTQVFVTALNELYIITSIITAAGVVLALMLRSGPAPKPGPDPKPAPPAQRAEPASPQVELLKPERLEPARREPALAGHGRGRPLDTAHLDGGHLDGGHLNGGGHLDHGPEDDGHEGSWVRRATERVDRSRIGGG
jgi:hypothetical protein